MAAVLADALVNHSVSCWQLQSLHAHHIVLWHAPKHLAANENQAWHYLSVGMCMQGSPCN